MIETKRFALRTILTATTGVFLCKPRGPDDNGIADLYELLGWMTGDSPFTHQLGRFVGDCKPWLLKYFPGLNGVTVPESGFEQWLETLSIPKYLDVPRIPPGNHEVKDPIQELGEMRATK